MHDELIDALAAGPGRAERLVGAALPPPPGEWSAREVVGHLRAADTIWAPRILFAVVQDGVTMPDVDERALQVVQDAAGLSLADQLRSWSLRRAELVGVLRSLGAEQWDRTCRHSRRGAMTVLDLARGLQEHEAEHLAQLAGLAST